MKRPGHCLPACGAGNSISMKHLTRTSLKLAIRASVAYFEVLGVALTPCELQRYLINPRRLNGEHMPPGAASLAVVFELVDELVAAGEIGMTQGFLHMPGRAERVARRIDFMKYRDAKLKRAAVIVRNLRWIPFVRGVFLSGSVAVGHPRTQSDLDFLIVVAPGRIWLSRALVDRVTYILGVKRHNSLTKDRACLNHYLTSDHLTIPYASLYNAMTYAHLLPLWEGQSRRRSLLEQFYAANEWLGDYVLGRPSDPDYCWQVADSRYSRAVRRGFERALGGRFGESLERALGRWQAARINRDPRTHAPGGRVVATSCQLEFHPDSREVGILKKYNGLISRFGLPAFRPEKDSGLAS